MFNKENKKVQKYLEESLKKSVIHLHVIQDQKYLQINIVSGDGKENIGWDGLVYMVAQYAQQGIYKEEIFSTITVNGVQLNYAKTQEFWQQFNNKTNYG